MAWGDPMTVEVGYEIEGEPEPEHLRSLRSAAQGLTDDARSIRISRRSAPSDHHLVVVRFSMRRSAQYKVVGDIDHRFKLCFGSFYEYRDTWIRFPQE